MTLTFSLFCNFLTCISSRRPSKCSVPMPCTISSKCLHKRANQAVHSWVSSGEDTWTALQALSDSLSNGGFRSAHHDAGRCYGSTMDTPAAPPGRVGIRPRFSARGIRQPPTCPTLQPPFCLQADDVESTGLCLTSFNLSQWWRWRMRCAHHTGGLARLARFGRGERRTRAS